MPFARTTLIALALTGLSTGPLWAQAMDYPNRQVNFVVPFAPGGGTDILGRLVGAEAVRSLRQAVRGREPPRRRHRYRRRPGRQERARRLHHHDGDQRHDGDESHALQEAALRAGQGPHPGGAHLQRAVRAAWSIRRCRSHSVADLVKLAKERQLTYGSGGAGAFHHLMGELFKSTMGIPMTHVPYKGTLPALNDVVAGHIELMFSDLAPAIPLIEGGKVRALGVTTARRAASAPGHSTTRRDRRRPASIGRPGSRWQCLARRPGDCRETQRRGECGDRRARCDQATRRPTASSRSARARRRSSTASSNRRPRAGRKCCNRPAWQDRSDRIY